LYKRTLEIFRKDGDDSLVGICYIEGLSLDDLQRMFNIEQSNPMFDGYPVTTLQKEALEKATGMEIDLSKFDYFVSCELAEGAEGRGDGRQT
jgi:hypothetical protein